jgi:hypothetical protein
MSTHYPTDPPKTGNASLSTKIEGDLEAGWAQADFTLEYDVNIHDVVIPSPQSARLRSPGGQKSMYRPGETLRIEGAVQRRGAIAICISCPMENVIQEGLFQEANTATGAQNVPGDKPLSK